MPVRSRRARRRWRTLPAALLLAAPACTGTAAGPATVGPGPDRVEATATEAAARAVLRVEVDACGTGVRHRATGVALDGQLVVTVAHTFERAAGFKVTDHEGRLRPARLVALDPARDLAVLRLDEPGPGQLDLGDAPGDSAIQVLTRAGDEGLEVKPGRLVRHVTVTLDGEGRRAALELDAAIEPGDSGSPVLNPAGEVVGLVFAASRPGAGPLTVDGTAPEPGPGASGTAATTSPIRDQSWAVAAAELASALDSAGTTAVPLAC